MPEIEQKPSWPRAGGVYNRIGYACSFRVTSVDSHFVQGYKCWSGEKEDETAQCLSASAFRSLYAPEDQSPIPALRTALEEILAEAETAVNERDAYNLGCILTRVMNTSRAALAERKEA